MSRRTEQIEARRDRAIEVAEKLLNASENENRNMSPAETIRFGELLAESGRLSDELKADRKFTEFQTEHTTMSNFHEAPTPEPMFNRDGGALTHPQRQPTVRTPTLKAFKGSGNRQQAAADAYDAGLWFKANVLCHTSRHDEGAAAREKLISRRGQAWFSSQNESSPTDGGYLVPPAFDNAVATYREQVGAMRKLARVVQMSSDTWTGFKQTAGTTVYFPGEEGEITASDANFSRYTLTAKKRAILTYVSNELLDDSLVDFMDILASDMGHQFALQEDNEGIKGDGTSTYAGVQGLRPAVIAATASVSTADTGDSTFETLDLDDFLATMSLLADKYRGLPLKWLCSGPFKWQVMDRIALAVGGTAVSDIVDGVQQPVFLGYPVIVSDRMPTTTAVSQVSALFGAFENAVVLGQRGGVRIDTSPHVGFTSDRLAVRAISRYDIHVHEEGDTSTAGAIVGLATAAS